MRIRFGWVIAALAIAGLTACTPGTSGPTPPAPTTSAAPLPTITQSNATQDIEAMINLAAQRAVGVADEDRHPQFKELPDFSCPAGPTSRSLEIAKVCQPTTATQPLVIEISQAEIGIEFQSGSATGASNDMQSRVLDAYIEYLTDRTIQRDHPELLKPTTQQDLRTGSQLWACKEGEIYAGVKDSMLPDVAQVWTNPDPADAPFFTKGTQGKC